MQRSPERTDPRRRNRRRGSWVVALVTVLALAGCATPSTGPTTTSTPGSTSAPTTSPTSTTSTTLPGELPVVPRLQLPPALPAGTRALVGLQSTVGSTYREYVIGATDAVEMDIDDPSYRELAAIALGWVSPTGVELRTLDAGELEVCATFGADDCDRVPDLGRLHNVGFSPDGARFFIIEEAAGSESTVVRVYDAATLELIVQATGALTPGLYSLPWRPDSGAIMLLVPVEGEDWTVRSVATLEVAPGAEPVVVEQGTVTSSAATPGGWSVTGQLTYRWAEGAMPGDQVHTIRSRPADGTGERQILGATDDQSPLTPLPDGSVIGSADGPDANLPHLFGPGAGQRAPLALQDDVTPGGPWRTWVVGLIPPHLDTGSVRVVDPNRQV